MNIGTLSETRLSSKIMTFDGDNGISVVPTLSAGTKIASVTIDNTTKDIYIPDLSNALSVVDQEPTPEEQVANPNVIWLIRKQ